MSSTATRSKRALTTKKAELSATLQAKAIEFFTQNKAMNAAKKIAEDARKSLYVGMKADGIKQATFPCTLTGKDGKAIETTLECVVAAPTGQVVDIVTLQKLVPMDTFLKIVSASQEAVKEHTSASVLAQCLVPAVGTENVKVAQAK